jgi:hypothetical protein
MFHQKFAPLAESIGVRLRGRVLVRFTFVAQGYFQFAAFLWDAKSLREGACGLSSALMRV